MALTQIRIPNITQTNPIVDKDGRASNEFIRRLNDVFKTITSAVNGIITAQNAADQAAADAASAQGTANQGVGDAAAAQATADSALALATTAVQQDVGPAWADATGTASRTAYASYVAPTISVAPTQAEVQGIANAVQDLSRHFVAFVNDAKVNGVLT